MDTHRRRIVAYIACNLTSPTPRRGSIHDLNSPHTTTFTGEISPSLIAVFDPDRQDYVLGHRHPSNLIRLTDLASQHPIDLTVESGQFQGVDHETGMRFSGKIDQDLVHFFDEADQNTYKFRV